MRSGLHEVTGGSTLAGYGVRRSSCSRSPSCSLLQGRERTMPPINDNQYRESVYEIVRRIPQGRVMTYGQIAITLGEGYTARTVGYVMSGSPDGVPWQRVINSQGKCSTGRLTMPVNLQQELLEAEGI